MDLAHPLPPASRWPPAYQASSTASSLPGFNELFGDVNERYPSTQMRVEDRSPPRQRARHYKDLGTSLGRTRPSQASEIRRAANDRHLTQSATRIHPDPAVAPAMDQDSLRSHFLYKEDGGNSAFTDKSHRNHPGSLKADAMNPSREQSGEADKSFSNPLHNPPYHNSTPFSINPTSLAHFDNTRSYHRHSRSLVQSSIPVRSRRNPAQQSRRRGLSFNDDQEVGQPLQNHQQTPHTSPQFKSDISSSGREYLPRTPSEDLVEHIRSSHSSSSSSPSASTSFIMVPPGTRCAHPGSAQCDAEPNPNWRKNVSDKFGRNKIGTKAIPDDCWVYYCRKHYQRASYRLNTLGGSKHASGTLELIRATLDNLERWGGVQEWEITLRRRELTIMHNENARAARPGYTPRPVVPIPRNRCPANFLYSSLGRRKTLAQVRAMLDLCQRECERTGTKLPDFELLPTCYPSTARSTPQMSRPSSSRREGPMGLESRRRAGPDIDSDGDGEDSDHAMMRPKRRGLTQGLRSQEIDLPNHIDSGRNCEIRGGAFSMPASTSVHMSRNTTQSSGGYSASL